MKKWFLFIAAVCFIPAIHAQTPNLKWAFNPTDINAYGGDLDAASNVIDASGNTYITGYFKNVADFDPSAATANLISAGGMDIFLAKYDINGNYVWAISMGGLSDDNGVTVNVDASGNPYITGGFTDSADFDPSAAVAMIYGAGQQDIFLAKYDVNGNYMWAGAMGGTGIDQGHGLQFDATGNIYITGYFQNNSDFDPSASTAIVASNGGQDFFIAKYDNNGNYLWVKPMGGTGPEIGRNLAFDGSGNIVIIGDFSTTVDFDPSGSTANLTSAGTSDVFLAKYDSNGNYIWAKAMGGTSTENGYSLDLDASDNIFITGLFMGTADFDPSASTASLSASGAPPDMFLAKYNSSGSYQWAHSYGSTGAEVGSSVAVDASGNVVLNGYFSNTVDFDPSGATANLTSAGNFDIVIAKYTTAGAYMWAKSIGGTSSDYSFSIALDASDNAVITGFFSGTVDFDPSGATANLTAGGTFVNTYHAKYDNNGNYIYAKLIGRYDNNFYNQQGESVVVDANGNSFVTGYFEGTVDFDPSSSIATLTSLGAGDIFIAKYDKDGNYQWAKSMGGSGNEYANSITLDSAGNIYITGNFNGTADFDPGAGLATLTVSGGSDIFLAKYNSSGAYQWSMALGGASFDGGNSVQLDRSGNPVVTGYFSGTATFDPSMVAPSLVSNGASDIFIAKYTSNGNYMWAQSIGGALDDDGYQLALDTLNNVYVTGYYQGTVNFNPAGSYNLTSAGSQDIYLAKFDPNGTFLWADGMGDVSSDVGFSVAVDKAGNAFVTGGFTGTADFDPDVTIVNLTSAGADDIFLAKYNSSGTLVWAKAMGGTSSDQGKTVTIAPSGDLIVGGWFYSTSDFDPSASTVNLTSNGAYDIFLAKYDGNGNYIWAESFGGSSTDQAAAIALDNFGAPVVTGYFQNNADFDPSSAQYELYALNSYDIYLAKYSDCSTTYSTLNTTACDSFMWQGNYYTMSGTYMDTIQNAGGCDSVMTLNLTINQTTSSVTTVTACFSYIWNSNLYTATGTYMDTIPNAAGCDSIMTLNLTINTVDTSVTVMDPTLTANASGAVYQWLDCNNSYSIVTAETSQTFTAVANGSYAVVVTENSCTDTSSCHTIVNIGLNDLSNNSSISLYPNPTNGTINLNFGRAYSQLTINVLNVLGQNVRTEQVTNASAFNMNLDAPAGVYFVELLSDNVKLARIKLIKQ